jgi:hypothetical protein
MATKLFQNADLKIQYPTDLWFIYPTAPGKQPTEDTVIGTPCLQAYIFISDIIYRRNCSATFTYREEGEKA